MVSCADNREYHAVIKIFVRMVKRSSPNLNYFIITGALIMYSSVYFYLIPSTDKAVVQARCVVYM